MKRIVLFVLTNLAVMVVLGIVLGVLGIDRAMAQEGLNLGPLLVFSAVVGFTGSIISLLISKPMAKWSTGAQVIDGSEGTTQCWLVETVRGSPRKPGSACLRSRSTKAPRTRSPRARSRTRRSSRFPPGF